MNDICVRALALLAAALLLACPVALAAELVTVDAGTDLGPATYRASGFLHGMTADAPAQEFVAPLKPRLFRDWADGPNGAFAIADRVRKLGGRLQLSVGDSHGFSQAGWWPGDGGEWTRWEGIITDLVQRAQARGLTFEWDIWNEPDGEYFWGRSREQWLETWRQGVLTLRRLEPKAVVVGPDLSGYDSGWMEVFLVYAKEHDVLPDVLSWHELDDADPGFVSIPIHIADAQRLMRKHGVWIDRLQMNEIIGPGMQRSPGAAIRYFAALEREKVDGACHACWDDAQAGCANCDNYSLDGLVTDPDKRPRATWWAYKAYADIAGRLVAVQAGKSVDGVAGRNAAVKEIRVALGRVAGGTEAVGMRVTHLRRAGLSGKRVHVTAERIPDSGWNELPAPLPALDADCPVSEDSVVVTLPDFGPDDAYAVVLRPAGEPQTK